jgi:hypothetical protein
MNVPGDQPHPEMPRQSGDPEIIGRNRSAGGFELASDFRVALGGFSRDGKKFKERKIGPRPGLVGSSQPGLLDALKVFAQHDYGERRLRFILDHPQQGFVAIGERGKRIGIEN